MQHSHNGLQHWWQQIFMPVCMGRTQQANAQSATTAILTNLLVRCASRFSFLEFATALEAEYPKVLAKRMAACLRRQAERQQLQLGPRLSSAQKARHAWGVQTVKAQPLIP